jgi:hypothetical protein
MSNIELVPAALKRCFPLLKQRAGVSTYSSDKRMLFHQEKLAWMLRFGFVSGHDFSRAANERKEIGLLLSLNGPTKVVP